MEDRQGADLEVQKEDQTRREVGADGTCAAKYARMRVGTTSSTTQDAGQGGPRDARWYTTDKTFVAQQASTYYKDLFETDHHVRAEVEVARERRLRELLQRDFATDPHAVLATSGLATRALALCPSQRMISADCSVREMWQAAAPRNSDIAMMIA